MAATPMKTTKKTAAKKAIKRSTAKKKIVNQPLLQRLYFTKLHSSRPIDDVGMPLPIDVSHASMAITISVGCNFPTEDGSTVALSLNIDAKAASEDTDDIFYLAEVHAIGLFELAPTVTLNELKEIAKDNLSYFHPSFSTVYAVAALELERLIEKSGLPSPIIPMSLQKDILSNRTDY